MRRPPRRDSPALPTPTRLLYLAGASAERDASTLQQLSALTGQVQVTTVGTAADVEQKIRSGGYHALVISHAWPQADTLSLISSLRRSNAPIAIVPVVTETQRDLYASAVAVGADDVLILLGGTLLHPTETLVRVRQSRYLPSHEVEAVRAAIRGQHAPPAPATGHPPAAPDHVGSPAELPAGARKEPPSTSSPPAARPPGGSTPPPLSPHPPAAPPPTPPKPAAFASIAGAADPDAVRRDLERRLREAESEGSARREAHAALVASKLELERAVQAHASAREVWEREREELLTEARSAVAATTVVESRLQAALTDVERLSNAHASAEAAWDATRREWDRAHSDQAAALEGERQGRHTAEAAHASERAGWDQTRQALEQRLETATALAASRDQLERAVGAAEAALRQATEAHAVERITWEATRRDLERGVTETAATSEARWAAESALDDARTALRSAEQARVAEREEWDRERAQLEARVQDIGAARGARSVLESELRTREAELATATAALETERAAAAGSRERLTALQAELDVLARARDHLEQALDAARADLRQLSEARANDQAEASRLRDQLERALDSARSELRQLNDARVADQADATEMRQQLEHALDAARNDLRDTGEARARDQVEVARARDRADALQAELELAVKARTEIDDRVRTAQADLQQAAETLAATRAAAQAAREALATKLSETESAARAERSDLERRIAALGTDLQQAIEAGASDRLALEVATEQLRAQRAELASIAAVHADADAALAGAQRQLDELGRARDAARQELDRTVRDHTGAAAAWEERRRAFEADLAVLHEARATERMDWMTARLALETRLSQADDELDRQREETETLRAELGRVAARYDRLSRSELFGYGVTTLDGWLVHCNDAFARLLGYSNAREALASASEQAFGADGSDVISADSLVDGQIRYRDAVLTRVDGESVRVLQSALLITAGGQDALVERIVLDLSDRTALEERLREAQRLEALGRLTAAMAPELEALAAGLETGMPAPLEPLDEGADALPASAVAELRQLVAFTRKQARPAALLDVNDALERLSPMLARLVSSHVEFALRLGPTALIAADEEDFEQMTTAVVVAARDHLTAGGSLLIETGMIDVGDTDRRPPVGHRSGSGAVLTVTAAGYGVQPTDPSATLEAVVERLAGTLLISGVPGRRVTLRVDLPRIR